MQDVRDGVGLFCSWLIGIPITHIAKTVGISRRFVYKWAKRFLQDGLEGLADKPGRGTGRRLVRQGETS